MKRTIARRELTYIKETGAYYIPLDEMRAELLFGLFSQAWEQTEARAAEIAAKKPTGATLEEYAMNKAAAEEMENLVVITGTFLQKKGKINLEEL